MKGIKVWFPVIIGESGTDVWTRRQADALRRRGIETEITWFPSHFQFCPFWLHRVSPPSGTTIVHANTWSGFAFRRAEIPLVVTEHLHALDPLYRRCKGWAQHLYHELLIRSFVKRSLRDASAVTAVSHFTAAGLTRTFGVEAQAIYNCVDTKIFSAATEKAPASSRPFRLLFVGNPSRRKGADLLPPIMRQLGAGFEMHFTSGPKNSSIKNPAPNMVCIGKLNHDTELVRAYHSCDVLFFPSRFEGFGLVAIEAMACSKPVIATNVSSLPEVVKDGVTGILCPRDDIPAFVAACRKLAKDPEICIQYGAAARQRAEKLFSEDIIIPQYVALYEELASGSYFKFGSGQSGEREKALRIVVPRSPR